MRYSFFIALLSLGLFACSSNQPAERAEPTWVTQPARVVDNGYIVHVGSGESSDAARAQFEAEGMAIQDLANECSFIPKGAQVEDRYIQKFNYTYKAFAKVAIEFQNCDEAKKAVEPDKIRNMASVAFTEQLKRYQDQVENGTQVADAGVPLDLPQTPERYIHDDMHFFVVRQYVAYQKQTVILAPATSYAANSPETVAYMRNVQGTSIQVQSYEAENPKIKTTPAAWSTVKTQAQKQQPHLFTNPRTLTPNKPGSLKIPQNPGKHYNSKGYSDGKPVYLPRKKHHKKSDQ